MRPRTVFILLFKMTFFMLKFALIQTRSSPLKFLCLAFENAPSLISFLLFLLFFNKKCKPLLDKPQTPGGSSIWIIEDHCVFLYSAIWAFLRFADTCVFYTQNASSLSKVWCMWDSWSQRCHVTEIVLLDFLFFNSLPTRCSRSPVGVLLFLLFLFRSHFSAVLPLILYGLLPLWPGVGAEGTFSFKSKAFSTTIRSLILDPWSLIHR